MLGPWVSSLLVFLAIWAAGNPVFRSDITLVKAEARVYDRVTGQPIRGLGPEDFSISDGDQRREIVYFAPESTPLDLLLLLDVSGTMLELLPGVAEQAQNALSYLGPGDRASVMAFGKRAACTQEITTDLAAVPGGIRRALVARVGLDTDINLAVRTAAAYLRGTGGQARRAILVITDNIQVTRTPGRAVERELFEADAVLDALVVRGRIALPRFLRSGGVFRFAGSTGGEVIEGNRPDSRLGEIIQRIRSRYSIHFRPVETDSDAPRRIRVELSPSARRRYPNAIVRARRSYFPHPAPATIEGTHLSD